MSQKQKPLFKLYYSLTVKDKNGKVKKKITHRLSHSFTKQFLQYFAALSMHRILVTEGSTAMLDTGNASRTFSAAAGATYSGHVWCMMGAEDQAGYGIVVGTGTNAESVSDYALQTICAQGTGVNNLAYARGVYVPISVIGSDVFFSTIRTMINNSLATVTVTEIGIYIASYDSAPAQRYVCLVRDKLAAGVDVDVGEILTVEYTFKTTN